MRSSWLKYFHELSSFCRKIRLHLFSFVCLDAICSKVSAKFIKINKIYYSKQLLTSYQIKHLSQWSKCCIQSNCPWANLVCYGVLDTPSSPSWYLKLCWNLEIQKVGFLGGKRGVSVFQNDFIYDYWLFLGD